MMMVARQFKRTLRSNQVVAYVLLTLVVTTVWLDLLVEPGRMFGLRATETVWPQAKYAMLIFMLWGAWWNADNTRTPRQYQAGLSPILVYAGAVGYGIIVGDISIVGILAIEYLLSLIVMAIALGEEYDLRIKLAKAAAYQIERAGKIELENKMLRSFAHRYIKKLNDEGMLDDGDYQHFNRIIT